MESKVYTGKDTMEFDKQYPLKLEKPLMKKPKYMNEVWVSYGFGKAHKGWVLSLTGGDYGTSMSADIYGDKISIFFPPVRGEDLYKGIQTWWLMDIGIGKTKQECLASYRKHDWFRRPKSHIQNDRFWAHVSKNERDEYGK